MLSRRRLLSGAVASAQMLLTACGGKRAGAGAQITDDDALALVTAAIPTEEGFIHPEEFSMVGVFDVDWLADPSFAPFLDTLAASPGAFTAVRFFGALNSGTLEKTTPIDGGYPPQSFPISFSESFSALEALTTRGLIPFVQLSFFPAAISPVPTLPPASFDVWQAAVRAFLDALMADPRFGPEAIRTWWFEVWNEPNIPVFWQGSFAQYLDLYRATAAVIRAGGYPIRLGGPALAYLPATAGPAAGAPLMQRFVQFLHDEPEVQCDFLSFHEKGTWINPTEGKSEPVLGDLVNAAEETARMALAIMPERCAGLPIINNEADMKVGFDLPYEPRMTERFPAWLASLLIAYDTASVNYRDRGIRFHAASDNANLQLIQAPFDGRRALMTRASTAPGDLLKVPVYHFYELLRLLGDRHGTVVRGGDFCYPHTDLALLLTVGDHQVGALFARYPPDAETAHSQTVTYTITDLPWQTVNIARFQIDATHSNAYTAAGGRLSPSLPDPATLRAIRQTQELTLFAPIQRGVTLADHTFHDRFTIAPFTTLLYWITPFDTSIPAAPREITATIAHSNVLLHWEPSRDPAFFSYVVSRVREGEPDTLLSPMPLRGASWIDTAPTAGIYRYRVQTISTSGIASPTRISDPLIVPAPT